MPEERLQDLRITIADDAAGSGALLERVTLQLRRAIQELPVEEVNPVREQADGLEGTKAFDYAVAGALAVKLLPEVVPLLCDLLKRWLHSSNSRRLTLLCGETEIEVAGDITPQQTAAIVLALAAKRNHGHKR
jgi:hypothetical protein